MKKKRFKKLSLKHLIILPHWKALTNCNQMVEVKFTHLLNNYSRVIALDLLGKKGGVLKLNY